MRKLVVSEALTLDGVFDAQTMGQWAANSYSDEREELILSDCPRVGCPAAWAGDL